MYICTGCSIGCSIGYMHIHREIHATMYRLPTLKSHAAQEGTNGRRSMAIMSKLSTSKTLAVLSLEMLAARDPSALTTRPAGRGCQCAPPPPRTHDGAEVRPKVLGELNALRLLFPKLDVAVGAA